LNDQSFFAKTTQEVLLFSGWLIVVALTVGSNIDLIVDSGGANCNCDPDLTLAPESYSGENIDGAHAVFTPGP